SSNGVFVNGTRIKERHALKMGDKIGLGPHVCLRIEWTEETVLVPPKALPTGPHPSLTILLADGQSRTQPLTADEITVGRGTENDIVVSSLVMSRQHLRLVRREQDYLLETVATARNRPMLVGVAVPDGQPLYAGDELVIGADAVAHVVCLRYESSTAVAQLPPPTSPPAPKRLTKTEIDHIVAQKNLLVRNLQITQGYHDVAHTLGHFLTFRDVNWFAFGTYASKTAGRAIRHETLPRALKSALVRSAGYDNTYFYLDHVLANSEQVTTPENVLGRVLEQVSLLLSLGNLLIFRELAWPFVDMVNQFGQDRAPRPTPFQSFLDGHFIPGSFDEGGQDWLRDSLNAFYKARFETDNKKRSELIFLGNILLALHEQSRLQPVIEKALAVPFDLLTEGLVPATTQEIGWFRSKVTNRAVDFSREMVLRAVTRMVMGYTLPHREMKLGQDVIAPTGLINFPQELILLENPRCRAIVQQYDDKENTLAGSGAANWGKLDDRMRFIIDFFRSYQRDKRLFEPPFLPEQVSAIKAGHFPAGEL
ncbi:MAG: FHA domain-containing protein, partial [Anaerolineales bacterium]|nr:FHA domain-containing protein [Anaerolineales bacterium]